MNVVAILIVSALPVVAQPSARQSELPPHQYYRDCSAPPLSVDLEGLRAVDLDPRTVTYSQLVALLGAAGLSSRAPESNGRTVSWLIGPAPAGGSALPCDALPSGVAATFVTLAAYPTADARPVRVKVSSGFPGTLLGLRLGQSPSEMLAWAARNGDAAYETPAGGWLRFKSNAWDLTWATVSGRVSEISVVDTNTRTQTILKPPNQALEIPARKWWTGVRAAAQR